MVSSLQSALSPVVDLASIAVRRRWTDGGLAVRNRRRRPKKKRGIAEEVEDVRSPKPLIQLNLNRFLTSKWDGTLSADQFCVAAEALIERWNEINPSQPSWLWNPCSTLCATAPSRDMKGFLSLENVCRYKESEVSSDDYQDYEDQIGEEICDAVEETNDAATLVLDVNEGINTYDFHILYSFSYRVPVLYFRGYRHDGQPLDLKHLVKNLPLYSLEILRESKWTYITQEEHPFLHRPWYMLHPCGTSDWMKLLLGCTGSDFSKTKQYLASWLSVVGQAVGLRVPFAMQKCYPNPV